MNEVNIFNKYKKIKDELAFKYKGYKIEEILAIRIWLFCQYGPRSRVSFRMRKSYGNMFQQEIDNLMIYGKYRRNDHEYTFDCVFERLKSSYYAVKLERYPDVKSFSALNIFYAFWMVFIRLKTRSMDIKSRIYWCSCLCYLFNTIDYLESLPRKRIRKLLCFSAIHEDENILKQYFSMQGATTYSMFHGTSIQQINNVTIDCLTYENLHVDYSLPWGQYGKDEFIKTGFPKEKLIVVGYPRNIELQPLNNQTTLKRCILLMSRSQFESSDIKLVKLLAKVKDVHFSIKLHPSCHEQRFEELCKQENMELVPKSKLLIDCLNNNYYDFAVAVNTTSYYESLIAGLPCLRFKDGEQYDMMMGDEHDEFDDINGFFLSLDWLKTSMRSNEYSQIREKILVYCLGLGIDKYREVLE